MKVSRSALLPYSARECFDLVGDVTLYPEFLPNCVCVEIIEQEPEEVVARMTFAKAGFSQSVTTKNILNPNKSMELQLVDGPFHQFNGLWEFNSLSDEACKVSFSVEFEVKSVIAKFVAGSAINAAAVQAMTAFEKRAEEIYCKRL